MTAKEPHPQYGNGLLLRQSFPVNKMTEIEGVKLALLLNYEELAVKPSGYGLGSYVFRDGVMQFVTFLPNIAFKTGLLPHLHNSCESRASDMSSRLSKQDRKPKPSEKIRGNAMSGVVQESRLREKRRGEHRLIFARNHGL